MTRLVSTLELPSSTDVLRRNSIVYNHFYTSNVISAISLKDTRNKAELLSLKLLVLMSQYKATGIFKRSTQEHHLY